MLIFNITFLVSDAALAAWYKWTPEQFIPFMLQFKPFSQPQVAKIISSHVQEGTSFSVQFHIRDMETLNIWNGRFGKAFQENCTREFGNDVIFFTTVLEII